jgi:hypothetical protein
MVTPVRLSVLPMPPLFNTAALEMDQLLEVRTGHPHSFEKCGTSGVNRENGATLQS